MTRKQIVEGFSRLGVVIGGIAAALTVIGFGAVDESSDFLQGAWDGLPWAVGCFAVIHWTFCSLAWIIVGFFRDEASFATAIDWRSTVRIPLGLGITLAPFWVALKIGEATTNFIQSKFIGAPALSAGPTQIIFTRIPSHLQNLVSDGVGVIAAISVYVVLLAITIYAMARVQGR